MSSGLKTPLYIPYFASLRAPINIVKYYTACTHRRKNTFPKAMPQLERRLTVRWIPYHTPWGTRWEDIRCVITILQINCFRAKIIFTQLIFMSGLKKKQVRGTSPTHSGVFVVKWSALNRNKSTISVTEHLQYQVLLTSICEGKGTAATEDCWSALHNDITVKLRKRI